MRRLALALGILAILAPTAQADRAYVPIVHLGAPCTILQEARVVRVMDGDTFLATLPCCECLGAQRVRLLAVNAPERGACYAQEAATALEAMIAGREVLLEVDGTGADGWGRLLRWTWAGGGLVSAELVRQGYARADIRRPDDRYADRVLSAEAEARAAGRGGWGACAWGR